MGHYAKVVEGIVTQVIVAEPDFDLITNDKTSGEWLETSYNTRGGIHYLPNSHTPNPDQSKALRKNYAGIGYTYDKDRDAFIPPKPFNSWILNEQTCLWESPVPYPNDNSSMHFWNEDLQIWETPPEVE
jgi:hypothetical protein